MPERLCLKERIGGPDSTDWDRTAEAGGALLVRRSPLGCSGWEPNGDCILGPSNEFHYAAAKGVKASSLHPGILVRAPTFDRRRALNVG
jgi:hypothetical protein